MRVFDTHTQHNPSAHSVAVSAWAAVVSILVALTFATPASAAGEQYEFDPFLSMTADCSTSGADPVADPGCPYSPFPNGPSARFARPQALAVDAYGNEYVFSAGGFEDGDERIDIFDDEGEFISEFALPGLSEMDVDSKGNIYAFETTGKIVRYPPSKYDPEVGEIEYKNPPVTVATGSFQGSMALDPATDQLFVAQDLVITRYSSAEEGNTAVATINDIGSWYRAMAIDGQRRRLYLSDCKSGSGECFLNVFEADAPYGKLEEMDGANTPAGKFAAFSGNLSTAIDEETGEIFVGDLVDQKVYQFDEEYEYVAGLGNNAFQANGSELAVSNGEKSSGDAFNRHYLFVTTNENNRVLAFRPPRVEPPEVQISVTSIGETEATLQAKIETNGADTNYAFEYVSQADFDEGGFANPQVAKEGIIPSTTLPTQVSAPLNGLAPGTRYRFRVLASNEGGVAEPVSEGGFGTYDDAPISLQCGNQTLRAGASAHLPDCRAYELVTPPETNGRRPKGGGFSLSVFPSVLVSPAGDAVSFKIEGGSLPGGSGVGSFEGDRYVAKRGPSGWTSTLAGPSGDEATVSVPASNSPDQGYFFWHAYEEGPLVISKGVRGTSYLYYPDGHSEMVGRGSLGSDPIAIGKLITENATHVVFETINLAIGKAVQLEPMAPPTGIEAVYDRTIDPVTGAEQTHVVSLLPGEVTPSENARYIGASRDGEGIAFAIGGTGSGSVGGTLYLRKDNAVTYEIGEDVEFAGISNGGERIFYVEDGNLFAFDTVSEEVIPFSSSGDVTAVNVAPQGTRAYFVSPTVLTGDPNPNGDFGQFGEQNLYLSAEGEISYVGTVTDRDVEGEIPAGGSRQDGLGLWTETGTQPAKDPSRVTPDGSVLIFQSRANLTGYDSGDFPQVYRFDSNAGRLHCLSCIPTGAAASGGASIQSSAVGSSDPPPLSPTGFVSSLTPDGKRVFFESKEALVSKDTNGAQDVYQWEEDGVGTCKEAGGCLYLISSGRSATDNYLYAHTTDGRDVFFATSDVLTSDDPGGTVSIYDARINGGFAAKAIAGECLGEACQPVVSAPNDPSPTSASFRGQGNVKEPTKARRCPSGKRQVKRRGKVRCVKKKQRQGQRKRANSKSRRTSK